MFESSRGWKLGLSLGLFVVAFMASNALLASQVSAESQARQSQNWKKEWPSLSRLKFPDHYYKKCLTDTTLDMFEDRDEPIKKLLYENVCACYRDTTLEIGFKKLGSKTTETRIAFWVGMQERSVKEVRDYLRVKCQSENEKFIRDVLGAAYFTEPEIFDRRVDVCVKTYKEHFAEKVKKNSKLTHEIFVHFCVCKTNRYVSWLQGENLGLSRKSALIDLHRSETQKDSEAYFKIYNQCWNEVGQSDLSGSN